MSEPTTAKEWLEANKLPDMDIEVVSAVWSCAVASQAPLVGELVRALEEVEHDLKLTGNRIYVNTSYRIHALLLRVREAKEGSTDATAFSGT
jgi:hypothetical protein